jgi:hypothetical protein
MHDTFQADAEQNATSASLQRLNGSARASRLFVVRWNADPDKITIFLELSLTLGLVLHISIIIEI